MTQNRRSLAVLFVTLWLVMLGFGIIIPILPFYVRHFGGTGTSLGLLMATYSVMQLFFAPFWGRLSDRIGRRPVILIGLAGYGISFTMFGMATHLWMLFAARILAGILSSATLPTSMAYVADITSHEDRGKGMGLLGAAMGLGMIVGPGLGGILGHYSLSMPFFVAGSLALLNLPFAYRFLPETHTERDTTPRPLVRRFSRETLSTPLLPLFLLAFISSFSMALFETTFAYFSSDRLGFGPRDMGILFAVLGTFGVMLQAGALGKLMNRYSEAVVVTTGLLATAVGFMGMQFVYSRPSLWVCAAFLGVGSTVLRPGVSTLVSKHSSEGQGASLGQMQGFDSLGRVVGPVIGGATYELHQGAPYALGATVIFLVLFGMRGQLKRYAQEALQARATAQKAS